jgi:hypothetical protein
MSTQEILLSEIKNQPEPVLRELLHYLRFLIRQREEEAWAETLPTREVEQEVLDILDATWAKSSAVSPAFDFLTDAAEDIYTFTDGKPFHDEG